MIRIIAARARRMAAVAASVAVVSTAVPALAGIDPAGTGRIDVDLPFTSSNVDVVNSIPMPGAIGATFRDDVMYVTGQNSVETFDVSNPAAPLPLGKLPLPHFENEDVTIGGNILLVAADHFVGFLNTVYVIDITDPRTPLLSKRIPVSYKAHTVTCLADCRYAYIAGQTGLALLDTQLGQVVKPSFSNPGAIATEAGSSHDVWVDSSGIAWVAGGRGTAGYDISDPFSPKLVAKTDARGQQSPYNNFIHHNLWRPNLPGTDTPGDVVLITEEDYARPQCRNAGSFQSWKINGPLSVSSPAVMTPIDLWTTDEGMLPTGEDRTAQNVECSAHWFEERDGFVSIAWYNNGTRFLDVRDPANIRQVGYYVPTTTSVWGGAVYWAPNATDIVYSVDASRGIDVLRIDVTRPDTTLLPRTAAAVAPPGAGAKPHPVFGWGCRIPAAAA